MKGLTAMLSTPNPDSIVTQRYAALVLRAGLGIVFLAGAVAKLERLLAPDKAKGIIDDYIGPLGYINQTFLDWLFASPLGSVLTPWNFLTTLSAFELVSGVFLIAGLMVRPLSIVWAFLLWSFVVSLPVVTTPGIHPASATYMSPAELVQVRDIALSGFFFVLYNLGSGAFSLDGTRFGLPESMEREWDPLGLLLRLSLAAVFIIGGFFAGYSKIVTFGMPAVSLAAIGIGLAAGIGVRFFAAAACAVLLWFLAAKIGAAPGVIGYFNSVKREFALLAAAGVLTAVGGGRLFVIGHAHKGLASWCDVYFSRKRAPGTLTGPAGLSRRAG